MKVTGNNMSRLQLALLAALATLVALVGFVPTQADAARVDNPSASQPFRMELTGGFLEIVGSKVQSDGNRLILGVPLDFAALDKENAALSGMITTNGAGYGAINVPQTAFTNGNCRPQFTPAAGGICFPLISIAVDDIAIDAQILPLGPATGTIDPLSGMVQLSLPLRIELSGDARGIEIKKGQCYIGQSANPLLLNLKTNSFGTFPTSKPPAEFPATITDFIGSDSGWFSGEPYSDEPGQWATAPSQVPGFTPGGASRPTAAQIAASPSTTFKPRAAGTFRGTDESWTAPQAYGCGLLGDVINGSNTTIPEANVGLPSTGNNTAAIDFTFMPQPGRNAADAILRKAVKSRFVASGISSNPWPITQVPTVVSAQQVSIDASTSYFKVGGHATERYSFDLGNGTFGAWTTNPVTSFTAPIIAEGSPAIRRTIRVRVKDSEGDIDVATRQVLVVPATDMSATTQVSSVAGSRLRAGSSGEINFNVKNNSTADANSLELHFTASLPTGVTATGINVPAGWTCNNTASTLDCTVPAGQIPAGATSQFKVNVNVATNAANPAAVQARVDMLGDPSPANNVGDLAVPVVKTDLKTTVSRSQDMIANGWHPYEVQVSNVGDGVTVGGSSVRIDLPSDFTYRAQGSGGTGWTCSAPSNPQTVTCSRSAEIAGNTAAPAITIWARVDRNTPEAPRTVTATVTTQGDIDAFGGSNSGSETGTVLVRTDLAADVDIPNHFVVGDPGVIRYQVTNESVVPTTVPTTISSTLPAGLTVASVNGTGWDCSATTTGGQDVSCVQNAGLAGGEASEPVNVSVNVAQAAFPGVSISVSLANSQDAFAPNNSDTATNEVRRLDLKIEKLAVRPFNVGIEGRYRFNVTNVGNAPTVGPVVVTDTLPDGLTLAGAAGAGWDCSASEIGQKHVECVLNGAISGGIQAAPIEARVNVLDEAAAAGIVENTAYVDTDRDRRSVPEDADVTGNNSSTIQTTAVAVDLSIQSTHQGVFRVGTEDLYSLTVRNVGAFATDEGASVTVTDDLPDGIVPLVGDIEVTRPGWVCEENSGDVECTLEAPDANTAAMAQGSTVTIDIPVQITDAAADTSDNVAEVTTARDSNPTLSPNNVAVDATNVERVDLAVDGAVTIAPRAGGIGEISVDVSNIGSHGTVNPTTVTVPLAAATSYRPTGSQTAGWDCSSPGVGTQITCVRTQTIAVGASAPTLKLRTNVGSAAAANWSTAVSVQTSGEPAERLTNNEKTLAQTLQSIDLTLSKSHDPGAVKSGTRANFKIKVQNVGNTPTSAAYKVHDTVNSTFQNVSASGPGWNCAVVGNNVDCTRTAVVAAGQSTPDITVAFNIPGTASGIKNSTATVTSTDDPFTANNSAGDPIEIVAVADVTFGVNQPEFVRVGDTVSVNYTVRNVGSDATSGSPNVKLRVSTTSNLEPIGGSGSGWDCEPADSMGSTYLDCELGVPLDAGDQTEVVGQFQVVADNGSQAETLAYVSTAGETNLSNNAATGTSDLSGVDLEATVAAVGNQYMTAGVTANRKINITNVGTAKTTGPTTVSIPLPDGVQWDSGVVAVNDWQCAQPGTTLTCEQENQFAAGADLPELEIGLRASRSNAPEVAITYNVTTPGDENLANNSPVRNEEVRFTPNTSITSGPSGSSTSRNATIAFSSDDSGASFECSVDGGQFAACASPLNLTGLNVGNHTVGVRAVNQFGMTDATPAQAAWSVTAITPSGPSIPVLAESVGGTLSLASLGSVPLPEDQVKVEGRLFTDSGSVLIPASGVAFKPVVQELEMSPGVNAQINISISATGDTIGALPNGGGDASLVMPVKAEVEAVLGGSPLLPEGTECSLKPVTFDLSGTYNESAGTLHLEQHNVGFPQVTGCGSFKGLIDSQLELPRNDIEMELDFKITKGVNTCPPGEVGTPPNCQPEVKKPNLAKVAVKGPKKVKYGKPFVFRASVKNNGEGAASNVKVCAQTPKALVAGKTKRCVTIKTIAAGKTGIAVFRMKAKAAKKAAKSKRLSITVSAPLGAAEVGGTTGRRQYKPLLIRK